MTLNNCTVTIGQYVESQTVETQYVDKQVVGERLEVKGEGRMPKENNYKEVVDWLDEEKAAGRDWYKMNDNNRSAMCRQISNILGWVVDQNSLRKAGR